MQEIKEKSIDFYLQMLESVRYMLHNVEKNGLDALHDLDKPKGVDWAIAVLNDEIKFYEEKLKEINDTTIKEM